MFLNKFNLMYKNFLTYIQKKLSSKINIDKNYYLVNKLKYLDIGSIGDLKWPFSCLDSDIYDRIEIEPQYELNELTKDKKIHNTILWSSSLEKKFYINKGHMTSSLFKPNLKFLKNFPELNRFEPISETTNKTITLDELFSNNKINTIDFLKIDVQGSELEILKGGKNLLNDDIVGMEIEVSFSPIYQNQPLFSDIDIYLRSVFNLDLWDINPKYFLYKDGVNKNFSNKGQLVYGDAIYFRSLETIDKWLSKFEAKKAKSKLINLINCSLSYGYYDYSYAILKNEQSNQKYLDNNEIKRFQKIVRSNSSILKINIGNNILFFIFSILANIFRPHHNRWASGGHTLGTRKYLKFFYRQ